MDERLARMEMLLAAQADEVAAIKASQVSNDVDPVTATGQKTDLDLIVSSRC